MKVRGWNIEKQLTGLLRSTGNAQQLYILADNVKSHNIVL